jgi:hypothetical protein
MTTLRSFKVVLTATRARGTARARVTTVTATGYRQTPHGWKLTATKQIGKASQWFWHPAEVCSLTVTQLKPEPSTATFSDTITVSLLEPRRSDAPKPTPGTGNRDGNRPPG